MRPTLICLAITATLLAACSTTQTTARDEAAAGQVATSPAGAETRADAAADAKMKTEDGDLAAPMVAIEKEADSLDRIEVAGSRLRQVNEPAPAAIAAPSPAAPPSAQMVLGFAQPETNTERYASHEDNPIHRVGEDPVSTFSIDVDTGSYSNVRRMLMAGQRPPADAVRAEEMINYFDYGYPAPTSRETPFRVDTELAAAPWNPKHELLLVGIQGYRVPKAEIPAANLVFLIDTSGSMEDQDKLPLLKESFKQMVPQLRAQDRVSIVVYAGSAGLVLPPTAGNRHEEIIAALDRLQAGGSTNGGEGLQLAYAMARQAFIPRGVNRVMLATDGDFNVGTVDQKALETMIADQRKTGIALTTLGFGTGNYNDDMAERLADVGNGNHAYIDTLNEGRKVLVDEMSSTMMTIAQDVKIQIEFNPTVVAEYRLIGYENRVLRREDFNNDKIDAGEIGAGHDVTALYELTLVGSGGESVDALHFGAKSQAAGGHDNELAWLRLRYKQPGGEHSRLIENAVDQASQVATGSDRLRMAAAVAAYADLLRGGSHVGDFGWNDLARLARGVKLEDRWGYRSEFLDLIERGRVVTGGQPAVAVSE